MSAHLYGNELKQTKRFELGELLRERTRHLLLLTATPHNGKNEDFLAFMTLLDPERFAGRLRNDESARRVRRDAPAGEGEPAHLRGQAPVPEAQRVHGQLRPVPRRAASCTRRSPTTCKTGMNRADADAGGGRQAPRAHRRVRARRRCSVGWRRRRRRSTTRCAAAANGSPTRPQLRELAAGGPADPGRRPPEGLSSPTSRTSTTTTSTTTSSKNSRTTSSTPRPPQHRRRARSRGHRARRPRHSSPTRSATVRRRHEVGRAARPAPIRRVHAPVRARAS